MDSATRPAAEANRTYLPMLETALLWGMRSWVAGRRTGIQTEAAISTVFTRLGAPDATGYLCGLMWTVANGASRKLAVQCPCARSISADEQTLVDALALTQQRQTFERLMLLRTLLRPMAATPAGQSATLLIDAVNRAGLFLDTDCIPLRHCAFPTAS